MRLQFIVCKVMQMEAYFCAARSKNVVDIVLMPQGLHDEPDKLREEVQKALNNTHDIQGRPYDASLLGYGLCSNLWRRGRQRAIDRHWSIRPSAILPLVSHQAALSTKSG